MHALAVTRVHVAWDTHTRISASVDDSLDTICTLPSAGPDAASSSMLARDWGLYYVVRTIANGCDRARRPSLRVHCGCTALQALYFERVDQVVLLNTSLSFNVSDTRPHPAPGWAATCLVSTHAHTHTHTHSVTHTHTHTLAQDLATMREWFICSIRVPPSPL